MSLAAAIGGHERGLPDAQTGVHDLFRTAGRAVALVGAVLETHQGNDLGSQCFAIELNSFFAASIKEEIWLEDRARVGISHGIVMLLVLLGCIPETIDPPSLGHL